MYLLTPCRSNLIGYWTTALWWTTGDIRAGNLAPTDLSYGLNAAPLHAARHNQLKLHPLTVINHAVTMATRTTRTGNALVQPQKLPAILAQQALQLRTLSNLRNSRPSWPRIGAPDNHPRKIMATISNVSNENTNQPVLVTTDNPSIVSFSMNKVCVALGYTGLAPSIANERGIINISSVSLSRRENNSSPKDWVFAPTLIT